MSQYHHLTIQERETIFLLHSTGVSIRNISKEIGRSPSTVSRE
ncbi:helix-turn-helix domain-containing protein [Enterococcus sp. AZ128]